LKSFQDNLKERAKKTGGEYETVKKFLESQGLEIYRRGEQFTEWEREAEIFERETAEIDGKILNLEKIKPLADKSAQAEQDLKDAQNDIKEAGAILKKSLEDLETAKKNLENLPIISEKQEELAKLSEEWESVSQRLKSMAKLEFDGNIIASKSRELEKAQETFETLQNDFTERDKYHKRLSEIFLRNQAGILAKELKPGKPCPVCGSAEHPNPAEINVGSFENISETSVKNAEASAEKARIKRDEKAKECADLNAQINIMDERFQRDLKETEINSGERLAEIFAQTKEYAANIKSQKDAREKSIENLALDY
jgi:exonuclease SbcC